MTSNEGEEKIFGRAWMYSQMSSFEDIGIIFVVLFFYVNGHSPISMYVCTKDLKLTIFKEAIERFLFQYKRCFEKCIELGLDPLNVTAFREWSDSGYVWMEYPYRFSHLRIFIDKKYMRKETVSLSLASGDLQLMDFTSDSEDVYISEIQHRVNFPFDEYVILRFRCK